MENKIGGKSLWQDVLTVTVDTTGKKRVKITPVAITMTPWPAPCEYDEEEDYDEN